MHVCVHVGQIDGTWLDNLGSDTNEATSTLTEEMDVGSPWGTFRIFLGSGSEMKNIISRRLIKVIMIDELMQKKTPHDFQKPHIFMSDSVSSLHMPTKP